MVYTVQDCCEIMERLAALDLALDWDNVGLQLGSLERDVQTILVTLTVTEDVAEKAVSKGVDLVISHHPLIFRPLHSIRTDQPQGRIIESLLKNDTALYVSHTNLDQASLGLNHWLAEDLGLEDVAILVPAETTGTGLGRVGFISPQSIRSIAELIEERWNYSVRIVGNPTQEVKKVAVCGGSGGNLVRDAYASGAEVLITGDVSYHDALDALELGLNVIDAGHFGTEQIMVGKVGRYLQDELGDGVTIIQHLGRDPFCSS